MEGILTIRFNFDTSKLDTVPTVLEIDSMAKVAIEKATNDFSIGTNLSNGTLDYNIIDSNTKLVSLKGSWITKIEVTL